MLDELGTVDIPPLAVLQRYWRELQQPAMGIERIAALADRARADGFDRGMIKWLSRLPHEPTEGDRISLQVSRGLTAL